MTAHDMCGRFEIFESARHFRTEIESDVPIRIRFESDVPIRKSGRPIRILIESRSFVGCQVPS